MKYLSYTSALEGVKSVFSKTDGDTVSIEDIFTFWGRNGYTLLQNQRWLGNKLVHWKYHDLVHSVYRLRNKKRVLYGVQLTLKGKRAVGKLLGEKEGEGDPENGAPDFTRVLNLIKELQKDNPDYQITFDVKLKENLKDGNNTTEVS